MTPITVTTWPDEATRTPNSTCVWIAEAAVDGRTYTARSRHGASNELARRLVAAGISDRPMAIHHRGLAGVMTWPSFHTAARSTFAEGDRPLRRVQYKERPEGVFLGSGTGQKMRFTTPSGILASDEPAPLEKARSSEPPKTRFIALAEEQKRVSSPVADDVVTPPADRREREAPTSALETRRCDGCDSNFRPAHPWSRFCSPACRVRAHRGLARDARTQKSATISESTSP